MHFEDHQTLFLGKKPAPFESNKESYMSDRTIGIILVVAGVIGLLVDLFAVQLRLSQGLGFGPKRELLLAVSIILVGAGVWFSFFKKKKA